MLKRLREKYIDWRNERIVLKMITDAYKLPIKDVRDMADFFKEVHESRKAGLI